MDQILALHLTENFTTLVVALLTLIGVIFGAIWSNRGKRYAKEAASQATEANDAVNHRHKRFVEGEPELPKAYDAILSTLNRLNVVAGYVESLLASQGEMRLQVEDLLSWKAQWEALPYTLNDSQKLTEAFHDNDEAHQFILVQLEKLSKEIEKIKPCEDDNQG